MSPSQPAINGMTSDQDVRKILALSDPYQILQVSKSYTPEELKKNFKRVG